VNNQQLTISIVIATKGRIDSLGRLLESFCQVDGRHEIDHELIVANNAEDPAVARNVDDLVRRFSQRGTEPFRVIRVKRAGKAFAINTVIPHTEGAIIAFLDDDVAVAPDWLKGVADFFCHYPFAAMQGTILLSPGSENDPELQRLYQRYRTICLFPLRSTVQEIRTLTGANMAVRKEIFAKIGLFDPRLGPGQSGTSDDTELAERIIRAGGRIGCAPQAVVYHEVDWSRLTADYFRFRHEQQGRSRLIHKKTSVPSIVADLARSGLAFVLHSALNNERDKYRAKGRCYHYRAMLREKMKLLFSGGGQVSAPTADPVRYPQKDLAILDRENP
jgi:GT2 family glycosyltransferase